MLALFDIRNSVVLGECRTLLPLSLDNALTETILIDHGWVSSAKDCGSFLDHFVSKWVSEYLTGMIEMKSYNYLSCMHTHNFATKAFDK